MEECGVSIINDIQPSESKSDKETIGGPKDDVEKAKAQLLELANERQATSFTAEVYAKQQHHKFLIGKNGVSIKKIRDGTGARIIFPGNNDENKEVITIIGKEENVKAAKEQLEAIIKDIDKVTEGEILIDPKHHKHFVSKRCEVIHRIQEECGGVSISFPRSGDDGDRVTLKGAKDCIEAAKQRISEIVSDLEAQVTIDCDIPQKHRRTIMGSRGVKVQGVSGEFDVQIKFSDRKATDEVEGVINGTDEVLRQCDIIPITGRKKKAKAAKQALIDLIPIAEEINVPFDLHAPIFGKNGQNVSKFTVRYGVHIELSSPEMELDVVKITGAPSNVAETKKALFDLVKDLEANRKDRELRSFEIKIDVDPEYYPLIIGRHGAVINKIRTDFNVTVSFPSREHENNSRAITIKGYEGNAQAARAEIMKIVNNHVEQLEISHIYFGSIIGAGGRNISAIRKKCPGVVFTFPPPESKSNMVTIRGSKDAVKKAKILVFEIVNESFSTKVYADQRYHKVLIGRNRPIDKIRKETGAFFCFPEVNDEKNGFITIVGKEANVKAAQKQLEIVINKLTEEEIVINPINHGDLISKLRLLIRRIEKESVDVCLSFSDFSDGTDSFTITGTKECVQAAKKRFYKFMAQVTIDCVIPHKSIKGSDSFKIRCICNEFDVKIEYPARHASKEINDDTDEEIKPKCDIFHITGIKENTESAKQALMNLIPITEEISLRFDLHQSVCGKGKNQRRQFMDKYDVHIELPPLEMQLDTIKISGTVSKIAEAKKVIYDKVQSAKPSQKNQKFLSFEIKLDVDPEYHSEIRHSSVIQKMCNDFNVKVSYPKKNRKNDTHTITIQGSESNANDIRNEIIKIINDLKENVSEVENIGKVIEVHHLLSFL